MVLAQLMERDIFGTHLSQASQVEGEYDKKNTKEQMCPPALLSLEREPTDP